VKKRGETTFFLKGGNYEKKPLENSYILWSEGREKKRRRGKNTYLPLGALVWEGPTHVLEWEGRERRDVSQRGRIARVSTQQGGLPRAKRGGEKVEKKRFLYLKGAALRKRSPTQGKNAGSLSRKGGKK